MPIGMWLLAALLLIPMLATGQKRPGVDDVLRKGAALVAAGKTAEARELLDDALRRFPGNSDLSFELGMIYFRQKDWGNAIENYRNSLRSEPANIKALFYLSESYFMESDLDRARQTIAAAARLAPKDAQVCQKYGEYLSSALETRREAISWLEQARRLNPELEHIDLDIGKAQFDLTDFPAATNSLDAALRRDGNDGQAAFLLAESWGHLGDWEKARHYFDYSLTHGHAVAPAYYGLGRALVQLGESEAALDPLRRALAMQPSLIQAHFQLGKAYRQLGRGEEARRETGLFTAMNGRKDTSSELKGPETQGAWQHVKPMLEANHEREAREYLAGLNGAGASDLSTPDFLLGAMYFSMGRNEDALRVLVQAKTRVPKSAQIAAYLGMVQLSSGEADRAEQNFGSALALDPSNALALIGMGSLRYQQQRWADAIESLEKSHTADPGVLFMLCDAYFRVGRTEEGALTAELVRAFGSNQKELMAALEKLLQSHNGTRVVDPH